MYLFVELLFSSKHTGLLAAFFLAISPWHIQFSRYGAENIYLPFFIIVGSYLFILSCKKHKPKILLLSAVFFGIGLYTYFQAYYLVPLFFCALIILYWEKIPQKKHALPFTIIIFCLFLIPLINGLRTGETLGRFNQVTHDPHNKPVQELLSGMITTYRDHFGLEFLFQKGDIGYHTHFITRFSVQGMGELYWFQLPLIILSFLYLIRSLSKYPRVLLFLLFWLMVYPLGSTLAPFADGGGPFSTRSIIGVIPFQILTAVGVVKAFSLLKSIFYKVALTAVLLTCIYFSFSWYLYTYTVEYPLYSSDFWGWQYGPREIISYFTHHYREYDELYMEGAFNAPDIFLKFYAPEDCKKCKVGTIEYYNPHRKQLFALTPSYLSTHQITNFQTKQIIYYPNHQEAFRIGEIRSL